MNPELCPEQSPEGTSHKAVSSKPSKAVKASSAPSAPSAPSALASSSSSSSRVPSPSDSSNNSNGAGPGAGASAKKGEMRERRGAASKQQQQQQQQSQQQQSQQQQQQQQGKAPPLSSSHAPSKRVLRPLKRSQRKVHELDGLHLVQELPMKLFGAALVGAALCSWSMLCGSRHLARHLHSKQKAIYMGYNLLGIDEWVMEMTSGRTGYYIDVGAFPSSGFSNTKLLEENGWEGLCADPMPRGFEQRNCGYIPRPISGSTGETLDAPAGHDCSQGVFNVTGSFHEPCSKDRVTSLGVSDMIHLADSPEVIDFVSVSSRNSGLSILSGFPWEQHCVRYWLFEMPRSMPAGTNVSFNYDTVTEEELEASGLAASTPDPKMESDMKSILESHRCRTATKMLDLWAACLCPGEDGKAYEASRRHAEAIAKGVAPASLLAVDD